jgi:hypothetical protein
LIHELIKTVNSLLNKVNSLEQSNQEILNKLNSQQTKVTTGFNQQLPSLGPRLQKINPENLHLLKVYESVTELMNEDKNIKRPSIMKAIQENTIYCGFRWQLVERILDPTIVHSLEPTKETKTQNLGYIAKLDANKIKILNVYLDRKTAATQNNYPSHASLDNPVKNGSITNIENPQDAFDIALESNDDAISFGNDSGPESETKSSPPPQTCIYLLYKHQYTKKPLKKNRI